MDNILPVPARYHQSKAKKNKKCIGIRTEIEVVDNYSLDKVHGLYPGEAGTARHWSSNFTFWAGLRDQMSFPVLKVTNGRLVAKIRRNRPQDTERCTVKRNSKIGISRIKPPLKCKCVDCEEDELCGGLWNANKYPGNDDPHTKKIHIVVSHCKHDLDWIYDFTKGYNIASIHVISKCGAPVNGAPDIATIQVLPNVGRCDHTYVYYMSTVLHQKVEKGDEKDSIIVFLKDDMSAENLHQPGAWNDFGSMVRLASTTNGFACGIVPAGLYKMDDNNRYFMSAYHDVKALFNFTIVEHVRNAKGYASDGVEFKSVYANIGSFYDYLGAPAGPLPEIVQVCYGGIFAASVSNIKKRDMSIWKAIEKSLSRGNNIQEGHYAERSWGYLLSTPLQPFQVEALRNHSDTFSSKEGLLGMLKGALLKQGFRSRKGRKGFINSLRRVEPKT